VVAIDRAQLDNETNTAVQEMRDRDLVRERDCIDDLLSDQPRQRLNRWKYRQRPESSAEV
jgi:hypothetical protein